MSQVSFDSVMFEVKIIPFINPFLFQKPNSKNSSNRISQNAFKLSRPLDNNHFQAEFHINEKKRIKTGSERKIVFLWLIPEIEFAFRVQPNTSISQELGRGVRKTFLSSFELIKTIFSLLVQVVDCFENECQVGAVFYHFYTELGSESGLVEGRTECNYMLKPRIVSD